jgi:hypothetical protein
MVKETSRDVSSWHLADIAKHVANVHFCSALHAACSAAALLIGGINSFRRRRLAKLLLTAGALTVAGPLLWTPALADTVKPKSAAKAATCKADCLPNNMHPNGIGLHGLYRSYSTWDPHLISPKGKKEYAQCVGACERPLPSIYIQKFVFGMGLTWFGKTQQSCYECHTTSGPNHLLPITGVSVPRDSIH